VRVSDDSPLAIRDDPAFNALDALLKESLHA